jgi:nucleoside-diphosphate-sugar epimerase
MIAVTGASGYVGGVLAAALAVEHRVLRLVRTPLKENDVRWSFQTSAAEAAAMLRAHGVTRIVHAAWDMKAVSLREMESGCVAGSLRLIEAAAAVGAGVIFISTISAFEGARSAYGRAKLQVERAVLDGGGVVLRLGLVQGDGGMYGQLRRSIATSRVIPCIGDGRAPQYLLPEAQLTGFIRRLARGEQLDARRLITLAEPTPIPFRDIIAGLASHCGRRVAIAPVNWRLLYAALWTLERLGLRLGVRSDSVLSYVYQDPAPDLRFSDCDLGEERQ